MQTPIQRRVFIYRVIPRAKWGMPTCVSTLVSCSPEITSSINTIFEGHMED